MYKHVRFTFFEVTAPEGKELNPSSTSNDNMVCPEFNTTEFTQGLTFVKCLWYIISTCLNCITKN